MKAQLLVAGTILAPGKRTVTAALGVMGLKDEGTFAHYHQVLNRASWSPGDLAHSLLRLLVKTLSQEEQALVFGLDDTIERRWGRKNAARGIYHDPVRSSESYVVKASGLRWISLLLTPLRWAERGWALPFKTVLAPSERYYEEHRRKPQKLTDRAQQMIRQWRRWLPRRLLVMVADSSYAALEW